jgi:hypothetical protein
VEGGYMRLLTRLLEPKTIAEKYAQNTDPEG